MDPGALRVLEGDLQSLLNSLPTIPLVPMLFGEDEPDPKLSNLEVVVLLLGARQVDESCDVSAWGVEGKAVVVVVVAVRGGRRRRWVPPRAVLGVVILVDCRIV